ncbi:transglycosylase SLT domain-containing protein, partial [Nocardia sp. KC 131]|uniref:transglycosylase SLT domain-containing protein n=1 Tax=Nocardia arseniciresistens TaxID=3392119 RepID=UPI00398E6A19
MSATRFTDFGFRIPVERSVRLDLATGAVVEYPALFGGQGVHQEGWRRYRTSDNDSWEIVNTVTGDFIAQHPWTDSVFRLPHGGTEPLPADAKTVGIIAGQLYLRLNESDWSYRIFDLDNRTTDGITHGALDPDHPQPHGLERAWSMITDPDAWLTTRPAGEFSRDMLEEINTTALKIGADADVLLAVMNAESGLRTTAYHPTGRYGLLQLTADQLSAAGWTATPDDYLAAADRQIPAIRTHLTGLDVPPDTDETGLWLALLIPQPELAGLELDTVIASPGGSRPELYATHGVADIDRDGRLTVNDLRRYLRSKHHDPRLTELQDRTRQLAAPIPDWPTLTEVNEGDEMAIIRPSAAQLGLTVQIVALQHEPGFDHEQVVSIDPPA